MIDEEKQPEEENEFERRMREIEQKAAQIRDSHKPASELGDSLHTRLQNLEADASRARQSYEAKQAKAETEMKRSAEQSKGLGIGLTAAYLVVGVPLLFALLGWLIDRSTHSNFWIGVLTVIGAVVGITMMVITINRANQDR